MAEPVRVVITIDTEADDQWSPGVRLSTDNLAFLPRFQALCERFGFPPTYLCTYEVVRSVAFDRVLAPAQEAGRAEVGAHLHPWSNPPFAGMSLDRADAPVRPYPSELPIELFEAKLASLTESIAQRTGRPPTSYRAGRWGFEASHAAVLERMGYAVDCSVTPLVSWADHPGVTRGGPDFTAASPMPYMLDDRDACRPGDSRVLEVPVTILRTDWLARRSVRARGRRAWERSRVLRVAGRKLLGLHGPQWFRPRPHTAAADLIRVYETARRRGLPLVEMMFHSSELMPGGSPFWPDDAAVEHLYAQLEGVFAHCAADGARGVTLRDFARDVTRALQPADRDTTSPSDAAPPGRVAA